jgi:hypothetical protein
MKATRILAGMVAAVLIMAWNHTVFAEEKSIALPVGTKVEKLGRGHVKFKLPSGRVVEVKGYSKSSDTTAMIGDSRIYDRTGKLIASAKQGTLKSGPKPREDVKDGRNYVKIDDDIIWLPATITFQAFEMKKKQGAKVSSPQPDPSGKK